MGQDTEYWPMWVGTDATQELTVWSVDDWRYVAPTHETIVGRGYGIHHARYRKDSRMVASTTTLGCINILDPDDAQWFGEECEKMRGMRLTVCLEVPPWEEWV
jgi:hypothetical protein